MSMKKPERFKGKLTVSQVRAEYNRTEAVRLRIKGHTLNYIGEKLGVSRQKVGDYIREAMAEAIKERTMIADMSLQIQIEQVDGVIRGLLPLCMHDESVEYSEETEDGETKPVEFKPNPKALSELIKYLDHKAKILGLYIKPEEAKTKDPLPWNDDD